ncbi:hypothetical protein DFQ28_011347 [Apophysomyces sp. BC1034]|nr:hypothetical protein DFQ30_003135 [Apophysomyces sp. BC1015]KAG0181208.1 hypothetical protein DFQ29_009079 [Apophysomyces sp. BC1021]KAG0191665.1 hypothetical protein DFQ28_011347 [Apophysomyces sp. BC1034]
MSSRLSEDSSLHGLESGVDTLSDYSSSQPQQRNSPLTRAPPPNKPSRRDSRLLYAEKYGLNTPGWNQSIDPSDEEEEEEEEDSDDDRPLSFPATPSTVPSRNSTLLRMSPSVSTPLSALARPVSVRNLAAQLNSLRPIRFIKPATQSTLSKTSVPSDMQSVQRLYEKYNQKVYMEGYLNKRDELSTDGKPCSGNWTRWYVELCGPVLTLWDASLEDTQENVLPQYINITDANVEIAGQYTFALNSAGANRYLLQASNDSSLIMWVCAIRLSCFECSKIHEIYTRRLLVRSTYNDLLAKRSSKMEGFLQVRFPGATEWQKYWTVVTDRRKEKRLFGKKSVPSRGQFMFFESKKSKQPIMTIVNVVQAYTVYPESPQLIDMATLLKVEGSMYSNKTNGDQQLINTSSSMLLMSSNTKELIRWLIGAFDAFKLYGRPSRLLDDTSNINALNFGELFMNENPRLFLETSDVQEVNVRDESLLDNKSTFAGIVQEKIRTQAPAPTGMRHNSLPLIDSFNTGETRRKMSMSTIQTPTQPRASALPASRSSLCLSSMPPRSRSSLALNQMKITKTIYASDESDEEDVSDDANVEDSDDDSVFTDKQYPLPRSPASQQHNGATIGSQSTRPVSKTSTASSPTLATPSDNRPGPLVLPNLSGSDDFAQSILGDMSPLKGFTKGKQISLTESSSSSSSKNEPSSFSSGVRRVESKTSDESDSDEMPKPLAVRPMRRPAPLLNLEQKRTQNEASAMRSSISESSQSSANSTVASDAASRTSNSRHRISPVRPTIQNRSVPSATARRPLSVASRPSGTASVMGDNDRRMLSQQWETSSVDPRMMMMGHGDMYSNGFSGGSMYGADMYGSTTQSYHGGDDGEATMPFPGEPYLMQNSLLDNYRRDNAAGRLQEDYARSMGQPLVQIPNKPSEPRAGLIGVISQLEQERKEKESAKNRPLDMERERFMMEQHQQMMHQQQMMMMGNPYGAGMGMPMMDPRMGMMQMPMMGQMPMMMPMMNPMMMQMQMMHGYYSPYASNPMWHNHQRFNGDIKEEEEDEDDNVPIGKPMPSSSSTVGDKRTSFMAASTRSRQRSTNY